MSDQVAARVQELRRVAGISREQLAMLCRGLGAPESFSASVVANIETGRPNADRQRRRDVTVDELVFMAAALNVPPLYLLFPVESGGWSAAKWFTGERSDPTPGTPLADQQRWNQAVAVLDRLRWYDEELVQWRRAEDRETRLARDLDAAEDAERGRIEEQVRAAMRDRQAAETTLARIRADMRASGIEPGDALPDALSYIDDDLPGAHP